MKIILYCTQTCPWCKKTKEFLKTHKVKFIEKDIGKDINAAQEMRKKAGRHGVPVIDAEGIIIAGFDEERLRELLKKIK